MEICVPKLDRTLKWNGPRDFRNRPAWQNELPGEAGFYAFTDSEHLRAGTVLYVGATLSLRNRVPQYDSRTLQGEGRPGVVHLGMTRIREWLEKPQNKVFLWWTLFPELGMEKELISTFVPRFNDKLTNEVAESWGYSR